MEEEFNGWVVCFFWKYGLLKVLCLRIDYLHNYLFISCCWVKKESLIKGKPIFLLIVRLVEKNGFNIKKV